jgi:hypothetical protein
MEIGKGKPLRVERARGEEQRMENEARERRERRQPGRVGMYTSVMPVLPHSLPRGVRIIDSRGGHAVALACAGIFLGIYLRSYTL